MDVQPDQGGDLLDRQLGMLRHERARCPRVVVDRGRHGLAGVHGRHGAEVCQIRPPGRACGGQDDGGDLLGEFAALQDGDEGKEEVGRRRGERRNRCVVVPHHGVAEVAEFDHYPHHAPAVFQIRDGHLLQPRPDLCQCVVGLQVQVEEGEERGICFLDRQAVVQRSIGEQVGES